MDPQLALLLLALLAVVLLVVLLVLLVLLLMMLRPTPWRLRLPGGARGARATGPEGRLS